MKNFILKHKISLICLGVSFLFMLLCSNNSFLYAFNDNQDVNWYITMGNGILNGKVPYKDLFEQKGPLVYFLFSLFCLFNNPFRVVFIFEVLSFSLFLYFSYKLCNRFVSSKSNILSLMLTAFVCLTSYSFVVGGGAVEEYCLPIFAYMLLCFFEFFDDNKEFNSLRLIIWGVLIGILMFVKFTLLCLPFIMFVLFALKYIKNREWIKLNKMVAYFTLGVIAVSIPSVIYFLINDGLRDFLTIYFYNNIFLYRAGSDIFYNLFCVLILCFLSFGVAVYGVVRYLMLNKENKEYIILFCTYFAFLIITGNFSYYFLPLTVFAPIGCAYFSEYIVSKKEKLSDSKNLVSIAFILFVLCIPFGNGTLELFNKKEDYVQHQIAKDIKNLDSDPSLFCYKLWDYGFYNVLGVTPDVKYYANNLFEPEDFPEMYEAFESYIKEKRAEFVVVEKAVYDKEVDLFSSNYDFYKEYSYTYYKDNLRSFYFNVVLLRVK